MGFKVHPPLCIGVILATFNFEALATFKFEVKNLKLMSNDVEEPVFYLLLIHLISP